MASTRNIKHKIRSVKSTQQITKAMKLVATSKVQKARAKVASARPFYLESERVIASIIHGSHEVNNPFLHPREIKNSAVVVVSGDRGLCGGYNVNVCKAAFKLVEELPNPQLIVVGTKGRDYFRRRKKEIIRVVSGISESPFYEDAREIGDLVAELYRSHEIDEAYVVYTKFNSLLSHEPTVEKLLPLDVNPPQGSAAEEASGPQAEIVFDPDADEVLNYIIPKYINVSVYGAIVEAAACEQAARMSGMDAATENAGKMIENYTTQYNRARQGSITQEINEIVGGANALG